METVITAVGPDHRGLADPIIHDVTGRGANIAEIQMYDHDEESLFAMLLRVELPAEQLPPLRDAMQAVGAQTNLSIRVWSPVERRGPPRLAICTTYRPEPALAVLRAIRDGRLKAEAALMMGNRPRLPIGGRAVRRRLALDRQRRGRAGRSADDRFVRRVRRRLPGVGPLHARVAARQLLEVRRGPNSQPAPRTAALVPWHAALPPTPTPRGC